MKKLKAIWLFGWMDPCGLIELVPVPGTTWSMDGLEIILTDSPVEADILFVAGSQNVKSVKKVKQVYDLMPEPKTVVAIGTCSMSGGTYWDSYNTVKLGDHIPVNLNIPGCPATPEAVFEAVSKYVSS